MNHHVTNRSIWSYYKNVRHNFVYKRVANLATNANKHDKHEFSSKIQVQIHTELQQ